jgi:hypothetical protein
MKNFRKSLIFNILALAILALSACKKDSVTPVVTDPAFAPDNSLQKTVSSVENGTICFDFVYPITVELPDGNTLSANSMQELETIYEEWFQQNSTETLCPALSYPLQIVFGENGTIQTANNEEELIAIIFQCIENEGDFDDCFSILYPVTILYPGGASASVNSDYELYQAYDAWEQANPNATEYPEMAFPITVQLADGTVQQAQSQEDIDALFEACYGGWEEPVDECFNFVFPISVQLPDGSVQVANSNEALDDIFFTWFENHPNDSTGFPELVYPFQIQMTNGDIVTVNNPEEFYAALEPCYGGGDEDDWNECFHISYPITVVFPDGSNVPVGRDDELIASVDAWYLNNPNREEDPTLLYPITVTMTADNTIVTVNNDEELEALFEECFECFVNDGEELIVGGKKASPALEVVKRHKAVLQPQKANIARALPKKLVAADK